MENNNLENGKRKSTNPSEEEPPNKKLRQGNSVENIYPQSKIILDKNIQECNSCIKQCTQPNSIDKDLSDTNAGNGPSLPNEKRSIPKIFIDCDNTETRAENKIVPSDSAKDSPKREKPANESVDLSTSKETENRDEAGKKIKWDCGRHFSDQTDQGSGETPTEKTNDDLNARRENNPTAETTVSSEEPPRNKCAYGTRCFRRNSEHKRRFSHPGDPDYDIPDTRPECPYGVRCYRKNPQHKRDFKHTNNRPSRAQTPIRGRMSNATSGTEQSSADEESVDESDYEPSYYGGTSDEYRSDLDGMSDFDAVSDCDDDK